MALDSSTLAQRMETELNTLYQAAGKGPLGNLGRADRVMLFSALAAAIVHHINTFGEPEISGVYAGNTTQKGKIL